MFRAVSMIGFALVLAACHRPEAARSRGPADVDQARIVAADAEPQNWLSYGRDYGEERFSPLTAINEHFARMLVETTPDSVHRPTSTANELALTSSGAF